MKPSIRKVVTRAPARTVRIINLKSSLPHPVEAESSLEADYIRRAALQPDTAEIIHQPFTLPVSTRGYTPDFLQILETATPRIVVEVKLEKRIVEYADLFDCAAEFLKTKDYTFYVLTERTLRKKKIQDRALLILRYAKASFPPAERLKVTELLSEYPGGLPIGTVVRKAAVSRELIIHLVAWKTLTTGPNLHIDDSAVVMLRKFSTNNETFTFDRWFGVAPWGITRLDRGNRPCDSH